MIDRIFFGQIMQQSDIKIIHVLCLYKYSATVVCVINEIFLKPPASYITHYFRLKSLILSSLATADRPKRFSFLSVVTPVQILANHLWHLVTAFSSYTAHIFFVCVAFISFKSKATSNSKNTACFAPVFS